MYQKGDFHIHSTMSDGNFSPSELVNKAKTRGVDIISITDHNCINGINEAILEGNKCGVKVIPGVELSTRFFDMRVHILGYFPYAPYDKYLISALSFIKSHNILGFNKIMKNTLNIAYRREHICIQKGLDLLRHYGATIILAHPVLLPKKYFSQIASLGFDGIEAKYFSNTEEDTKFFLNYAKQNNMIYTAGSDFHRNTELYRAHGNIGDVYLTENEINNFLTYLYRNE